MLIWDIKFLGEVFFVIVGFTIIEVNAKADDFVALKAIKSGVDYGSFGPANWAPICIEVEKNYFFFSLSFSIILLVELQVRTLSAS